MATAMNRPQYEPSVYPPAIDLRRLQQPLTVRIGDPAALNVDISGSPTPTVRWYVGKNLILNDGPQYRISHSGFIHSLCIAAVEDEISKGIFVIAANSQGEDRCKIDIIPYKGEISSSSAHCLVMALST